ncbi:PTS transporter subunit EIIC, partial [Streptomyces caeruleatus]
LPWLIITGMHHSFNPYVFQSIAKLGYEPLMLVVTFVNNINQGIACLAVALKTKNKNLKTIASTSGFTALVAGVTEPALYGVTLKYR